MKNFCREKAKDTMQRMTLTFQILVTQTFPTVRNSNIQKLTVLTDSFSPISGTVTVKALFDYVAQRDDELTLTKNCIVTNVKKADPGNYYFFEIFN